MTDTLYPGADRSQWFAEHYPGSFMNPTRGILHTTEGTGWPDYNGGGEAPHVTAKADFTARRLVFRQHFPFDHSARALVNAAGGVETNTAGAIQIELIGTCDPRTHQAWAARGIQHIYWPEAPDWALRDLAEFMAWQRQHNGIPLDGPARWAAYPASYGAGNGVRMSFAAWNAFRGWAGHQHVPENHHGDPGNIAFATLLSLARSATGDTAQPSTVRRVVVWAGATLSAIALLAGVSVPSLLRSNPQITNPNEIKPGQTLTLPEDAKPVTPPGSGTPPPTPTGPSTPGDPAPSAPGTALAPGARGTEVRDLQQQLNKLGNHLVVDGVYGPETTAAVNSVIRAHPELGAADGVAGPKTRARIASLAAQNNGNQAAGSLGPDARGTEVATLQRQLTAIGYLLPETGFYGPQTTAAVNAFIRLNPSLGAADGVAGPKTRARIASAASAVTTQPVVLKSGMRGPAVKELQQQLKRIGYAIPATGYYGPMTSDAVNSVIRRNTGLGKADGIAGPLTRKKIAALAATRVGR
ncbi:peptidoglycan-binding protein [Kitasatospora sp. NPDC059327]|uniref:PGRP and LysM peptidoglycan-binding domain-containing protein n=1 Tax=Kitasatospora sp. NPDC059327 TaxID=3346803 RepID=UPI00367B6C38